MRNKTIYINIFSDLGHSVLGIVSLCLESQDGNYSFGCNYGY